MHLNWIIFTELCFLFLLIFILPFSASFTAFSRDWVFDQEIRKAKGLQILEVAFLAPMLPAMDYCWRKKTFGNRALSIVSKKMPTKFLDEVLAAFREETFANANFDQIAMEYDTLITDPVYFKHIMIWRQPFFKLQREMNDELEQMNGAPRYGLLEKDDWIKIKVMLESTTPFSFVKIDNQKAKLYYLYCLYFQALVDLVDEKGQLRLKHFEEEGEKKKGKKSPENKKYLHQTPAVQLFLVDWIQTQIIPRMEIHFLGELFKWGDDKKEKGGIFVSRFLIRSTLKPFAHYDQRLQLDYIFGFAQNNEESDIKLEKNSGRMLFFKIIMNILTMNFEEIVGKIMAEMDELAKNSAELKGFVAILGNVLNSSQRAISAKYTNENNFSNLFDFFSDLFGKIAARFGIDEEVNKMLKIKSFFSM